MKLKTMFLLITTVFLWGSSFIFIKIGLEEVPPITLALLRFAIATPFMLLLAGRTSGLDGLKDWRDLFLLGLMGVAAYHIFQNIGMGMTSASESSIIIASNPIFITLFGRRFLGERISPLSLLGIVLAFVGVAIVILRTGLSVNWSSLYGNILCLGSVFSWTAYSIYGKKKLLEKDATQITAYSFLFGSMLLAPMVLFFEKPVFPTTIVPWFSLLALSFLCSGVAYLFWYKALEERPASEAGSFLFLIPVIASVLAYFVLGERLDTFFFVGAVLVIIGVIMTSRAHHDH
ncbi:MAG: DMT family transporter [Candidatus Methanomethylicaceae archaeon]